MASPRVFYDKPWHRRHAEQERIRARDQRIAGRELMNSMKTGPCVDCGSNYPPECMDFDHLPGTNKLIDVSRMITFSKERMLAEIAKCELVCANCHRIRTKKRNHEGNCRGFAIRCAS